ncbi:nucleoside phosphorylase domain-containing protein [Aspergillus varians]
MSLIKRRQKYLGRLSNTFTKVRSAVLPYSNLKPKHSATKQTPNPNPNPNLKLIIFDFDGTLMNTLDAITTTWDLTFKTLLPDFVPPPDELHRLISAGTPAASTIETLWPAEHRKALDIDHCVTVFRKIYMLHGLPLQKPFDPATAVLRALAEQGIPMAIVSNKGAAVIKASMELHGWTYLIPDEFVIADPVYGPNRKPHPAAYTDILVPRYRARYGEDLEVGKGGEEILMVGDTVSDIRFAKTIGARVSEILPTIQDFRIAIICALVLEADAVEALFDETYDRLSQHYAKNRHDKNAYINGRIGKHNVVLCYLPGMGKGAAASVASSLQFSYTEIKLALVVGVCGGTPGIHLGDVVISDSVIEYDFGRQYPGAFSERPTSRARLDEFQTKMIQHLRILQEADKRWVYPQVDDVLFESSYLHKHYGHTCCGESDSPDKICQIALEQNCDDLGCEKGQVRRRRSEACEASTHIGTVASADTVMKSAKDRDEIVRREKVIGFEMEGAGVWDNVPCIIIKGVCDYADSHKRKSWQEYAAATGASAAKVFLEYWRPYQKG